MPTISKEDLKNTADSIAAKNKQIDDIKALQSENKKLKDVIGKRAKGGQSSVTKINGLQTLNPALGKLSK